MPFLLTGKFYLLINVIDQTQMLYYMLFLNIKYPIHLTIFYKGFENFQYPFIPNFFELFYEPDLLYNIEYSPRKFQYFKVTPMFINNVGQSFTLFFGLLGIYIAVLIIQSLLDGYVRIRNAIQYIIV